MTEVKERYFVNAEGVFLGIFVGAKPPKGAIELDTPPAHGKQLWQSGAWEEPSEVPEDFPLNPAQFDAALSLMGITLEQIDAAIDAVLTDLAVNTFAKSKARKSTSYWRGDDLFPLLAPKLNLTNEQIDAAWLQAKDFR